MKRNALTLKKLFAGALAVTILSFAALVAALMQVAASQDRVSAARDARYRSYLLADELRQSSDDLTRLARTYVVTGDPSYETQYFQILDIRNGKAPRPQHYERIYWDFVAAGEPKPSPDGETAALADLMKKAGFTEQEFAKLSEAQRNSDELVKAETIAMNAVKGLYDDGTGHFTRKAAPDLELARRLVHDESYHRAKSRIMKPLNEFLGMLDDRTAAAVDAASASVQHAYLIAIATLAVALLAASAALVMLYRTIRRRLAHGVVAAEQLAAGDLSVTIDVDRDDEIGRLMGAINGIGRGLALIVAQVRGGTDTIATASREIAAGNQDLSQRTEEQASSLQQTAASIEELTSTVKQNADNARQASQLAASASAVAVKGGGAVDEVVTTMSAITQSSRRIADIIGVIDGIAFQTNILALNAAVEAARAGEQGRGFAVVAGEVRNLAQRSAAAAKEIKALIDDSVAKVDSGAKRVETAGATMEEMVMSIRRVTDIMGEITAASLVQSAGIEQVNQAVAQMDQVTQQNAALVEEAAAAAESMHEQAKALAEAVAVFKVMADDPSRVAFAPPASAMPPKTWPEVERRGRDRARNVARLPVRAAGAAAPAAPSTTPQGAVAAGKKTGTDADNNDWAEF